MSTDAPSAPPASPSGETSRRRALALLGAGGAAGLATLLSGDDARAGHDQTNVLHLGVSNVNPAGLTTSLRGNGSDALTILGRLTIQHEGGGGRLRIFGPTDPGDSDPTVAVLGMINGVTPNPEIAGVQGIGAAGDVDPESGVGAGAGVRGVSGTGWGVHGIATGAGIGVEARSGPWDPSAPDGGSFVGHALVVPGRSAFSTAGSATIPAGAASVFVSNPAVSADSHISVTLASNPGPRQVTWVERSPGSGFTVHLSSAPAKQRPETALTYLIVETRLPAPGI